MKIEKELLKVNFRKGRTMTVDQLTIHVTEGTHEGTKSHFNYDPSDVSAHFEVLKNGRIIQYVEEWDVAFHNGRVFEPTAPLVLARPGINPNEFSIGIEHEGSGKEGLTVPQLESSLWLMRDLATRHRGIRFDRNHIVGHREVYRKKDCPGKINVDAMVIALNIKPAITPGRPEPPRVVWSDYFNDYLIVTRYVSDTNWSFVTMKDVKTMAPMPAQTPLSLMPRA